MVNSADEQERVPVNFVPDCFKELAQAAGMFYHPTELIIIRLLINFNCLDESELEDKMSVDTFLLQSRLSNLKYDRIIRERVRTERDEDRKLKKILYYFVNYRSISDIVKYKLLHVGKAIKTLTTEKKSNDLFKCTTCSMTFTEIDAGQLFDSDKNDYYCTHCHNLVEENKVDETRDLGISVADFNTRTARMEVLLRQCDGFRLDPKLFEPIPRSSETETTVNAPKDDSDSSTEM